jgi:hypothetical protein
MRRDWTAALAALLLAGCGARAQTEVVPVAVGATRVPMDREDLLRTRLGPLTYAGGYSLKAGDTPRFGGLSGLDVSPDGRLIAVADTGELIEGRLRLDAKGRLEGVEDVTIRRLADDHGKPFATKKDGDAEDVTWLPEGGFAVSFEQDHRVLVYRPDGSNARLALPMPMRPGNVGIEALAYWTDPASTEPRLVMGLERGDAFACSLDGTGCRQLLDRRRDTPRGFRLTGLDALPDGRLVAIYRAASLFGGLRAIIAEVRPGAARPVRSLAQLAGSLTVDNMEAIAAIPKADGSVRIYVASDDNFMFLQRTLLLAFDWK